MTFMLGQVLCQFIQQCVSVTHLERPWCSSILLQLPGGDHPRLQFVHTLKTSIAMENHHFQIAESRDSNRHVKNSYVKLPEGMCRSLQNPINLTTSTMHTWCQLRHTSTISATVMLMISPGEKIPQCGTELGGPYGWHSEYRFPQWIIVILVLTVSRIAYRTIKQPQRKIEK